jgi:hypothetical protein
MKQLLTFVAFTMISQMAFTQTLKTPSPSPAQTVKQDFALSSVEVSYSRPAIKGRNIFGDLVPYGKVWRTGANAATTITFGDEVSIGGTKIPAGKYGLLTIPGASEWTVIISKQTDVNNPANYKQSEDAARVTVPTAKLPFSVQSFMINFDDVKATSLNMLLVWDNTSVTVPITADIDAKVMASIEKALSGDKPPYFAAAAYYAENGKDLNKALQWIDKGIAANPDAFYAYYQKANLLVKLGRKNDAITTAKKSIELSKAANNADYVALNEKLIASLK